MHETERQRADLDTDMKKLEMKYLHQCALEPLKVGGKK